MFIYSGNCRLCETGLPTDLVDDFDNKLKTGDIVLIYMVTKDTGVVSFCGLTAVVANHYDNFHGFPPVECIGENKGEPFIMGIASCDIQEPMENYPRTVWRVHRLKLFSDAVNGENWSEYGFRYSDS